MLNLGPGRIGCFAGQSSEQQAEGNWWTLTLEVELILRSQEYASGGAGSWGRRAEPRRPMAVARRPRGGSWEPGSPLDCHGRPLCGYPRLRAR